MQPGTLRGTILLAHGSRDPEWRKPVVAVADRIRAMAPDAQVRCAYLELMAPDLASCVDELATLGTSLITVLPLFFGMGKHAREDVPLLMAAVQLSHPDLVFDVRPAVGEQSAVIDLFARIALSKSS
jgi:sirohydrochlorin cobaltochelatase